MISFRRGVGSTASTDPVPSAAERNDTAQSPGRITGRAPAGFAAIGRSRAALDPAGTTALSSIRARALLEKLSNKSDAIYEGLGKALASKLGARLAGAPKGERQEIKALLHFSAREASHSSKQDRLEVRTAVAGYLASGGGVAGARLLREVLGEAHASVRQSLIASLAEPKGRCCADLVSAALLIARPTAHNAARLGTADSPVERLKRLAPMLNDFPADPSRAGQVAFANDNIAMKFGASGRLEIQSVTLSMSPPTIPDSNRGLDQDAVDGIRDVFQQVGQANYSTQGVTLDFMRFMRTENEARGLRGEPALSLKEGFARYQPDGAAVTTRFNGRGDCMCHAERIVADLKAQGLEGRIVGHLTAKFIEMPDPSSSEGDEKVFIPGQSEATAGVTHLDVIVPYTTRDGEARAVVISPGIGTADPGAYNDMPVSELVKHTSWLYKKVDPQTGRFDAGFAQKAQVGHRHNLHLLATPVDGDPAAKKLVGIDLLAGTLYLNRAASGDYRAAHGEIMPGQENGAISIDFKSVMADPTGAATLRTWDAASAAYTDTPTNKLTAFLVMATAIKNEFGQPDEFVDDLMTLASHHDEYRADLLSAPLVAMADAKRDRDAALSAKPDETSPGRGEWQAHFDAAAERIRAGDAETARRHYKVAAAIA